MKKSLWDAFCDSGIAVFDTVWKIYNTKYHNRLITNDYGKLIGMDDLDDAEVVSIDTSKVDSNNIVKAYVRYDSREQSIIK